MKNKNNPEEELIHVKGHIYFSESEKTFYEVKNDNQKHIKNPSPIVDGIEKTLKDKKPILEKILGMFKPVAEPEDENDDDEENYFL